MKRKTNKLRIAAPILLAIAMSTPLIPILKPIQAQAASMKPITVLLDGKPMSLEQSPIITEDGRVLVQFRAIYEALGAKVNWDPSQHLITADLGKNHIEIQSDYELATSQLAIIDMLAKPMVVNGHTMVSVRFLANSLGADVSWDGPSQTVRISSKPLQLVRAIETGDVAGVHDYLANGGSPDVTVAGTSAVTYALSFREEAIAKHLSDAGGKYQYLDVTTAPEGATYDRVVFSSSGMALEPLLPMIKKNQPDTFNSLLYVALHKHDLELLDDLANEGANLPAFEKTLTPEEQKFVNFDVYDSTALSDKRILTDLLKGGLDPQAETTIKDGLNTKGSLLHLAALFDLPDAVPVILQYGGKINGTNDTGETPLMIAAEHGNTAVVQALLQAGADPNVQTAQGLTALDVAHLQGNLTSAQLITAAGGKVGSSTTAAPQDVELDYNLATPNATWTELEKDSYLGRTDEVKRLLVQADAATREDALLEAAKGNNTETVRAILQSGPVTEKIVSSVLFASISYDNNNEMLGDVLNAVRSLPLSDQAKNELQAHDLTLCATRNEVGQMQTYLNDGFVPVETSDNWLLNGVSYVDSTDALSLLLQHGADIKKEPTALLHTILAGHEQAAELLVKAGADPNATYSNDDDTALMVAVQADDLNLVQALIQAGANVNAKTSDGTTALSLALSRENQAIIQALQAAGATN